MTAADDVLRALRDRADGMTDAELSALLGKRHQSINQTCRWLADQGRIVRHPKECSGDALLLMTRPFIVGGDHQQLHL